MSNVTAAAAAARFRAPTALLRSASDDESWSNNGSERLPRLRASVRYAPLIHRGPDRVIPMIDRLWCAGLERPTRCEQPLTRVQNPENLRLSAHSPERINTKPSMPHLSILPASVQHRVARQGCQQLVHKPLIRPVGQDGCLNQHTGRRDLVTIRSAPFTPRPIDDLALSDTRSRGVGMAS